MKRTLALAAALAAAITLPAMALELGQISGDWKQFEGRVQRQWGKLTNDDLQQAKGDQKILAGRSRNATALRKRKPSARSKSGSTRVSTHPW